MNLKNWNEANLLNHVSSLLHADEAERALLVLDNVPAYFRDNPTTAMTKLRGEILGAMITAHAYMSSGLDAEVRPELAVPTMQSLLRGLLVKAEVERYTKKNPKAGNFETSYPTVPHLIDVGPGEYFIPMALQELQMPFTYWDIVMDKNTAPRAYEVISGRRQQKATSIEDPTIFLALEIIEHLADPRELAVEALRHSGKWPERVHLSTPRYCYDGNEKNWNKPCGLPHLRCYTPKEFVHAATYIFPGYVWQFYESQPMSLRGMRSDTIDPEPLTLGG